MSKYEQSSQSHQQKLIDYLQQFGSHISHRKNTPLLEQQLSSLSKAYNQAQQTLLITQKAFLAQSTLLEKYRSLNQVYKMILKGDTCDEGIFHFIQHLQSDNQNQQIHDELRQIRQIIPNYIGRRRASDQSRHLQQLKKQVSRLSEQKQNLDESTSLLQQQNIGLKRMMMKMEQSIKRLKQQLIQKDKQIIELIQKTFSLQANSQQLQQKVNTFQKQQIFKLNQFNHLLDLLKINKQNNKNQYILQIKNKIIRLQQYKNQYLKLKQKIQQTDKLKRQIEVLKFFLNDHCLNIFQQYQKNPIQCLWRQLRQLALTQHMKKVKIEQYQQKIWSYRIKELKSSNMECFSNKQNQDFNSKVWKDTQIQTSQNKLKFKNIKMLQTAISNDTDRLHEEISQFK